MTRSDASSPHSKSEVGILGQDGFFDQFPIKFSYAKREINLMTGCRD